MDDCFLGKVLLKQFAHKNSSAFDHLWITSCRAQSILKCPLLRIALPCRILRASTLLCRAHLLSSWRAKFLLEAAAAAPGPITSNLPSKTRAWPRTPHTDKDLRRKEVDNAISASSVLIWPLLPSWGPATLTLETARWWIRECRSSDASPNATTTMPWTFPRDPNLSSTGPTVFRAVPQYVW